MSSDLSALLNENTLSSSKAVPNDHGGYKDKRKSAGLAKMSALREFS